MCTINSILLLSVIYKYIMVQTSGRVSHLNSICDAAVRNKCRTSSETRLGLVPPSHPTPYFLPCFINSVQLRLSLQLSDLFAADYSLLDCCGLVVCLPLSLSVVCHFDLSGQAKYFLISFKGTSKTKQHQNQQQNNINKNLKQEWLLQKVLVF